MQTQNKYSSQKKIATLWLVFSFLILGLFVLLSLSRHSEDSSEEWTWLLSQLSPGLSAISGSLIYSATNQSKISEQKIDKFFTRIVMLVSMVYLSILTGLILSIPFAENQDIKILDHLTSLSLLVTFMQAIVLGLLGIFFAKTN